MIRNIANVVHDLSPLVKYLKQKSVALENAASPAELVNLIGKIQADAIMLERYLDALNHDIKTAGISKAED